MLFFPRYIIPPSLSLSELDIPPNILNIKGKKIFLSLVIFPTLYYSPFPSPRQNLIFFHNRLDKLPPPRSGERELYTPLDLVCQQRTNPDLYSDHSIYVLDLKYWEERKWYIVYVNVIDFTVQFNSYKTLWIKIRPTILFVQQSRSFLW